MLLFHRVSEKSVILHEEINSPQADAVSVVGSPRTHFAIFINLHVPLKKISCGYGRGESGNPGEVLEKLVVGDHAETVEDAGREIHIEGEDVVVVGGAPALAIPKFELQGFIFSEVFREKDWRDRLCLRVLLTPLDLRNVNFQIFIPQKLLVCWNKMAVAHIFHKLLISALLFMKMTS